MIERRVEPAAVEVDGVDPRIEQTVGPLARAEAEREAPIVGIWLGHAGPFR